jgi:hypothetical protein
MNIGTTKNPGDRPLPDFFPSIGPITIKAKTANHTKGKTRLLKKVPREEILCMCRAPSNLRIQTLRFVPQGDAGDTTEVDMLERND